MKVLSVYSGLTEQSPGVAGPRMLRRLVGQSSAFELHGTDSARRDDLESYIARCFARAYQAHVHEFAPLLVELRCAQKTSGVVGIRSAANEPLFLERYLDVPIETLATQVAGNRVIRSEVVELGNLAALRPGACQLINIFLVAVLQRVGFRYAVMTCTSRLEQIFRKQHFVLTPTVTADPQRLGSMAESWGSYYDTQPRVVLVDIAATMSALEPHHLSSAVFALFAESIECFSDTLNAYRFVPQTSVA